MITAVKETLVAHLVRPAVRAEGAVILGAFRERLHLKQFSLTLVSVDTIVPWSMVNVDAARTAKPALVILPLNAPPLVTSFALERASAAVSRFSSRTDLPYLTPFTSIRVPVLP